MKENAKILLIVNHAFFMELGKNIHFLRHFPKQIATWIDYDFEITDSIIKRKSSDYDYTKLKIY